MNLHIAQRLLMGSFQVSATLVALAFIVLLGLLLLLTVPVAAFVDFAVSANRRRSFVRRWQDNSSRMLVVADTKFDVGHIRRCWMPLVEERVILIDLSEQRALPEQYEYVIRELSYDSSCRPTVVQIPRNGSISVVKLNRAFLAAEVGDYALVQAAERRLFGSELTNRQQIAE